jgi:hypothetical protein
MMMRESIESIDNILQPDQQIVVSIALLPIIEALVSDNFVPHPVFHHNIDIFDHLYIYNIVDVNVSVDTMMSHSMLINDVVDEDVSPLIHFDHYILVLVVLETMDDHIPM